MKREKMLVDFSVHTFSRLERMFKYIKCKYFSGTFYREIYLCEYVVTVTAFKGKRVNHLLYNRNKQNHEMRGRQIERESEYR